MIEASYDPVTGIYYPIKWDDFHSDKTTVQQNDRVSLWNVKVEPPLRRRGRPGAGDSDQSSDDDSSEEELVLEPVSEEDSGEEDVIGDEELDEPEPEPPRSDSETESPRKRGGASPTKTPSKKRKRIDDSSTLSTHTPAKKRQKKGVTTQPTPHSKAALRARKKFKIRPPSDFGQDNTTLYTMEDDPFLRAMHTLHVGERPDSLPCRDEEYVNIFENVIGLLQEASGGCICGSTPHPSLMRGH